MMAAMASQKKTLYEILGIPQDANSLDIGLAYQRRTAELNRAVPPDPHAPRCEADPPRLPSLGGPRDELRDVGPRGSRGPRDRSRAGHDGDHVPWNRRQLADGGALRRRIALRHPLGDR